MKLWNIGWSLNNYSTSTIGEILLNPTEYLYSVYILFILCEEWLEFVYPVNYEAIYKIFNFN